jgi:hypothetical protein
MLESYSPYQLLTLNHPLLTRELAQIGWEHDPLHLAYFSFEVSAGLLGLQLVMVGLISCGLGFILMQPNPRDMPFVVLLLLAMLHIGVSVGADVYTLYTTIQLWQSRSQREHWDALRLTLPTDTALIEMYAGLAELKAWRALYADTTLRFSLSIIMGMAAVAAALLFFQITGVADTGSERIVVLSGAIALLTALAFVYTRAPLWRFRATVMFGLLVAESSHDVISALFAGLAGVVALRLFVIAVLLAVLQLALMWRSVAAGVLVSGLLIGVAAGIYWLTRPVYRRLRGWSQRRLALRMVDQ